MRAVCGPARGTAHLHRLATILLRRNGETPTVPLDQCIVGPRSGRPSAAIDTTLVGIPHGRILPPRSCHKMLQRANDRAEHDALPTRARCVPSSEHAAAKVAYCQFHFRERDECTAMSSHRRSLRAHLALLGSNLGYDRSRSAISAGWPHTPVIESIHASAVSPKSRGDETEGRLSNRLSRPNPRRAFQSCAESCRTRRVAARSLGSSSRARRQCSSAPCLLPRAAPTSPAVR